MIVELVKELNELDEHPTLEAKECSGDEVGSSLFETVCSFANEPGLGGGRIVLGVARSGEDLFGGYEFFGVGDPDKLQADIATGCAERFNHPIRPRIVVEEHEEKVALIVEVEELAPTDKPLYFTRTGLPRGAWRRIGSTDQRCTDDDMVVFYGDRRGESYDLTILSNATLDDFDPEAIEHYRVLRAKVNPSAEELAFTDDELLRALNAIRREGGEWKPTLTGLLLFGGRVALRRELPMVRVDYVRVAGKEWVGDANHRFETTVDMRGPLLALVDRALAAVMDDLPKGFELKEGAIQAETPTLPSRVLREAIVNAVMHRSYRDHQPTQIVRYSNRIEIRNAGFSLKNEDALGEPGSELRNPNLAAVFHETNVAETKGSGIRTMRRLMEENGFSLPTFESNRGENFFASRFLLHHFLSEEDLVWLRRIPHELTDGQRIALIFVREQGAVDNPTLRQLTGVEILAASQELRRLRDLDLVEQRGKGTATHYVPGPEFPPVSDRENASDHGEHGTLGAQHGTLEAQHGTLEAQHGTLEQQIPAELSAKIGDLGKRPGDRVRPVIQELCSWRDLSAAELAKILGRSDSKALKREHLRPMIEQGELEYTHPDMERHPDQAYRTPTGLDSAGGVSKGPAP